VFSAIAVRRVTYARGVPELRNVIVFTIGATRYAVELRWVREVVTLGFVTTVPTAPSAIGGVCNLHGTILPVVDVASLLGHPPGSAARQGDGALVLEADGTICALRVDQIDHVATLPEREDHAPSVAANGIDAGQVLDANGRVLALLDPSRVLRRAVELVTAASEPAGP
jgi:chemotaxis signal transduction protein